MKAASCRKRGWARPIFLGFAAWLQLGVAAAQTTPSFPLPDSAVAQFGAGANINIIEVAVSDRERASRIELIGPGGVVWKARSLVAEAAASQAATTSGFPPPDIAIKSGAVISALGQNAAGHNSSNQIVSTASIPLAEPLRYRRSWQEWRIRIEFGTSPGPVRVVTLPAPRPPA
jgi:hypothetical protein